MGALDAPETGTRSETIIRARFPSLKFVCPGQAEGAAADTGTEAKDTTAEAKPDDDIVDAVSVRVSLSQFICRR